MNYCVLVSNKREHLVVNCDFSGTNKISHRSRHFVRASSCHAEAKALKIWTMVKKRSVRSISGIFSIRAKLCQKTSTLIISNGKPCIRCFKDLEFWGIKKIFYSEYDGSIVSTKSTTEKDYSHSSGDRACLSKS